LPEHFCRPCQSVHVGDNQEKFVQLQDGFLQAVQGFARQVKIGQGELEPGQGFLTHLRPKA
jgi:hypothetical protein